MKFFSSIFLFLFLGKVSAQDQLEVKNIATLTKVWGFLKYYHPEVAKGKMDWDKEFMIRVKTASALKSKEETSRFYLEWIESLGEIPVCMKCDNTIQDSLKMAVDLKWTDDSTDFNESLISKLNFIELNRTLDTNYYVSVLIKQSYLNFENENKYVDSISPSLELRLLCVSRYWNIVHYFFSYKYLIGSDWNDELEEMIPACMMVKNELEYNLMLHEMTAKLNDSHAGFTYTQSMKAFGNYWAPFRFKLIDKKAVVVGFYNDTLAGLDDIRIGDVILEVNDEEMEKIIERNAKYISASNEPTFHRKLWNVIFNGFSDSVNITFERNGVIDKKKIRRHKFESFHHKLHSEFAGKGDTLKIVDDGIAYVNLFLLKSDNAYSYMSKLRRKKAIILDVRNYPDGVAASDVSECLNKENKPFVSFSKPLLSYPGMFKSVKGYSTGYKNKKYFKGKVIVLVNEETQSLAEFCVMMFQTAPDVICLGSQTAGADGNVSWIPLPGGAKAIMTSLGVYYPDGRETQRIGIVPDIEVKPTIQGIREGRDEVLEKAIEVINKK